MNKIFASSKDPNEVSMTIQGAVVAMVPIIIGIFKILGVQLSETAIMDVIQGATAAVSAIFMLWGSVRKLIISLKKES